MADQDSVYMAGGSPRLKWKCGHCKKRNDHRVALPVSPREVFVCRMCKRASTIQFQLPEPAQEIAS